MLAAILAICGTALASVSLSSCEEANAQNDNPAEPFCHRDSGIKIRRYKY
jgi:hypothetical protein